MAEASVGYLIAFDIYMYCGKTRSGATTKGLAIIVTLALIDWMRKQLKKRGLLPWTGGHLYMDNFYSCVQLFQQL